MAKSYCDSSWLDSFEPTPETARIMDANASLGNFIAEHSEPLGSLDGNDIFARVSSTRTHFSLFQLISLHFLAVFMHTCCCFFHIAVLLVGYISLRDVKAEYGFSQDNSF